MTENRRQKTDDVKQTAFFSALMFLICIGAFGCGYSNESLYPDRVTSVYVEMFDNRSFWRGVEYKLTDALAKRIEAQTPYKVVSSRDRADSIISGQIVSIDQGSLSRERQTGRLLEKEVLLEATVSWKNLKTAEMLMNNQAVNASASYSEWQNQGFDYASSLAANKLAEQIVEQMEKGW
jgi:hypothetical protein